MNASSTERSRLDLADLAFAAQISPSQEEELRQLPDWNGNGEVDGDESPSVGWGLPATTYGIEHRECTMSATSREAPTTSRVGTPTKPALEDSKHYESQAGKRACEASCDILPVAVLHGGSEQFQPTAPAANALDCVTFSGGNFKPGMPVHQLDVKPAGNFCKPAGKDASTDTSLGATAEQHPIKQGALPPASGAGMKWMTPLGPLIGRLWPWARGNAESPVPLDPAAMCLESPARPHLPDVNDLKHHDMQVDASCHGKHPVQGMNTYTANAESSCLPPSCSPQSGGLTRDGRQDNNAALPKNSLSAMSRDGGPGVEEQSAVRAIDGLEASSTRWEEHARHEPQTPGAGKPPARKRRRKTGMDIIRQYFHLDAADLDVEVSLVRHNAQ